MRPLAAPLLTFALLVSPVAAHDKADAKKEPVPGYTLKVIEGFKCLIHHEVLEQKEEFKRAPLDVLELELKGVAAVCNAKTLKVLRGVTIWVEWDDTDDPDHGVALAKYYGGSALWVLGKGKNPAKARNIEIVSMKSLTKEHQPDSKSQRIVILHELAHAVHHVLLGWDNIEVRVAFRQAKDRGLYDDVKTVFGKTTKRAYAARNDAEYFAELSCAYLDKLNYYPFDRERLKVHDLIGYKLVESVWGKQAGAKGEKETTAQTSMNNPAKVHLLPEDPASRSEPVPDKADREERAARLKLATCQGLINDGKKDRAQELLSELIKRYPETAAAKEAKGLLEELKP